MLTHSRSSRVTSPALPTVAPPWRPRVLRVVAVAAACGAVGAATIVIVDDQPAPRVPSIAEPSQPVTAGYSDTEANKVASMRALSAHIAEREAAPATRYQDLEANKARSQHAR
jgi:hypothetical protein